MQRNLRTPQLDHRSTAHGRVAEPTLITAVDPPGRLTALRAGGLRGDSPGGHTDVALAELDFLDHQAIHLREQCVPPL
ncbi:hypothetical protein ACWD7F_37095 [Streptomyces sp. NPDC005122]